MKIININPWASSGKRFNGISLKQPLAELGIESKHITWEPEARDEEVIYFGGKINHFITRALRRVERHLSIQSLLQVNNPFRLLFKPIFRQADIAHYHIVHTGYFSLLSLPLLTRLKPSVWTLHDPWALTGHCIHPFDCEKWKTACHSCPMLDTPFKMQRDHTAFMFKTKKKIYQLSKIELIVASKWMLNMVQQSPLLSHMKMHYIPFGLDLNFYKPLDTREAKKKLGLDPDTTVICFRAVKDEFKGYEYIIAALEKLSAKKPICILTMNYKGLVESLRGKFLTVELGYCSDDNLLRDAFNASDIFLMPSLAESFGMMAIEAMACGKPVIAFENTGLAETIFAPDPGIAVPLRNVDALASAIQRLIDNPTEAINRGQRSREVAEKYYDIKLQAQRTAEVYQDLLENR